MMSRKSEYMRTLLLALTAFLSWGMCASSVAISQSPPAPAQHSEYGGAEARPHKRLKFEVVSIRPSRPDAGPGGFAMTPDGYRQTNMPLTYTLLMAYLPVANFPMDRIKGVPSWVEDVRYDIEAKVAPEDVPLWQSFNQSRVRKSDLEAMLQEVLRDRMHLVAHKEPISIRGYALVFRKQSLKLVASNDSEPVPKEAVPMPGGGMMLPTRIGSAESSIKFYRTSMDALAMDLTQEASATGSIIENRTGLAGNFDFTLLERSDAPDNDQEPNNSNNSVVRWNVRAIGLDLVPAKIASWNLVIDHMDRPSAN